MLILQTGNFRNQLWIGAAAALFLANAVYPARARDPEVESLRTPWMLTHDDTYPLPAVSDLAVSTLDGKPVDLAAKPGWKVIYFWSAACPCVSACEHYSFVPLEKQFRGRVSFFGVVSDGYDLKSGGAALTDEVKKRHLPYSILLDTNHTAATALRASVTPQAFLLDPDNRIVFAGMPDDSRRYLKDAKPNGVKKTYLSEALAEALSGKPVSHPTTELEGCVIAW